MLDNTLVDQLRVMVKTNMDVAVEEAVSHSVAHPLWSILRTGVDVSVREQLREEIERLTDVG